MNYKLIIWDKLNDYATEKEMYLWEALQFISKQSLSYVKLPNMQTRFILENYLRKYEIYKKYSEKFKFVFGVRFYDNRGVDTFFLVFQRKRFPGEKND